MCVNVYIYVRDTLCDMNKLLCNRLKYEYTYTILYHIILYYIILCYMYVDCEFVRIYRKFDSAEIHRKIYEILKV